MEKNFNFKFQSIPGSDKGLKQKTLNALEGFNEVNIFELFRRGYTRVKKNNVWFVETGWTTDYALMYLDVLYFRPAISGDFVQEDCEDYVDLKGEAHPASDRVILVFPE